MPPILPTLSLHRSDTDIGALQAACLEQISLADRLPPRHRARVVAAASVS